MIESIEQVINEDNNKGWFNSLSRDLSIKIKECEELKNELDKVKKERVSLFLKIERLEKELQRIKETKSVSVEWKETGSGARSYCGSCGHYVSRFETFCKHCGCVIKWAKRPWKGVG